jgi:hypothetical protein
MIAGKGKKLRLLNLLRERLLIEPEVYASAAQKWLPQKLLKQLMLQLLKEWCKKAVNIGTLST